MVLSWPSLTTQTAALPRAWQLTSRQQWRPRQGCLWTPFVADCLGYHLLPFACLPLVSPSCCGASHDVNYRKTVHQPASCILSRRSVSLHATMVAETGICAPAANIRHTLLAAVPLHAATSSTSALSAYQGECACFTFQSGACGIAAWLGVTAAFPVTRRDPTV